MSIRLLLSAAFLVHSAHAITWDGCTSVVVSGGATHDGSALTSHANDCSDCDFRVVAVPAKDHAPGSMRAIYDGVWDQYPRLVDPNRSAQYQAAMGINSSQILGYIPQVNHTYALWEGSYGLMNEKGVGMGESTCFAWLSGKGVTDGGDALFSVGNLMAVALERCATARCAIETMGDLASRYGFYGEDSGYEGAGETVTVVDATGEAWVFHISGGLPEKKGSKYEGQRGALWGAQRLPDGHVATVANSFIIRDVDPEDTENFMTHPGLFELAQEAGLWDGVGPFDFVKVMMPDLTKLKVGKGHVNYMVTLRMFGIFRRAAPSLQIPLSHDQKDYPFSVPVDQKVSHVDVMDWFRDHYEGTPYDMTTGVQAGPFGTPNRLTGGAGAASIPGQFARGIAIHWTSYTVLLQSGGKTKQPIAWFAPDTATSSVFVPFFAKALSEGGNGGYDVATYGTGSQKNFSFGVTGGEDGAPAPAWWAFDFVANWMELSYRNMSKTYVMPKVAQVQREVAEATEKAIEQAAAATSESEANAILAAAQTRVQRDVVSTWWKFAQDMIVRYNDYMFNYPEHDPTNVATIGLPGFWLEMTGYNSDSWKPQWIAPTEKVPTYLPVEVVEELGEGVVASAAAAGTTLADEPLAPQFQGMGAVTVVAVTAVAAVVGAFTGNAFGYRRGRKDERDASSPTGTYLRISE